LSVIREMPRLPAARRKTGDRAARAEATARPPVREERRETGRLAALRRTVESALGFLRLASGGPDERPIARIKARQAALGFPFRRRPVAPPPKPERECDCVPWSW
jgi:hypothetical protein